MGALILDENQRDCLQDLIDLSLDQVSEQLEGYLGTLVRLRLVNIQQINAQDFTIRLDELNQVKVIICQGFFGLEGICGEALMIYQAPSSDCLIELLGQETSELSINEQIIDLGSMTIITLMNVFAKHINNQLIFGSPRIIFSSETAFSEQTAPQDMHWKLTLRVKISFQFIGYSLNCTMFLLVPKSAISYLKNSINRVLAGHYDGHN